jgi:hypothetical protein
LRGIRRRRKLRVKGKKRLVKSLLKLLKIIRYELNLLPPFLLPKERAEQTGQLHATNFLPLVQRVNPQI